MYSTASTLPMLMPSGLLQLAFYNIDLSGCSVNTMAPVSWMIKFASTTSLNNFFPVLQLLLRRVDFWKKKLSFPSPLRKRRISLISHTNSTILGVRLNHVRMYMVNIHGVLAWTQSRDRDRGGNDTTPISANILTLILFSFVVFDKFFSSHDEGVEYWIAGQRERVLKLNVVMY